MTSLRNFIIGLFITFGAPWLILIIVPAIQAQKLQPLHYDKDKDGMEGAYPPQGIYRLGQLIYAQENCSECHTQMIRPAFWGSNDQWKKGWGSYQGDKPSPDPIRTTTWRDFLGEPYAYLGIQRNGPDLANVGYRLANVPRAKIHQHLYAPRSVHDWSIMPNFRHLYKLRPIQGNGSPNALELTGDLSPPTGYEVVPTDDAETLVDYLLSLKKDAPIPGEVPESAKK